MEGSGGINELSELGQPKGLEQNAAPGRVSLNTGGKASTRRRQKAAACFQQSSYPVLPVKTYFLTTPPKKGHTFVRVCTHTFGDHLASGQVVFHHLINLKGHVL